MLLTLHTIWSISQLTYQSGKEAIENILKGKSIQKYMYIEGG